jgi:hypothetical protein
MPGIFSQRGALDLQLRGMRRRGAPRLVPTLTLALVTAACGAGGPSHRGRTITFETAGNFQPSTIVGTYSVPRCAADARTVVRDARLYYVHSTGAPGPADLYYYDLRFAYAHLQADGCTSSELGEAMQAGLTARQRDFLLHNVSSDLHRAFRAALAGA